MIRCDEDLKIIKEILEKIESIIESGKHVPTDVSDYYEYLKFQVSQYELFKKNRTR